MKSTVHPHKLHKQQPHVIQNPTGMGSSIFIVGGVIESTRLMKAYSGHFSRLVSDASPAIKGRGIDPFLGEQHSAMLVGRLEDKVFTFKLSHKGHVVEYVFEKKTQMGHDHYLWTGKVHAPDFVGSANAYLTEIKSDLTGQHH